MPSRSRFWVPRNHPAPTEGFRLWTLGSRRLSKAFALAALVGAVFTATASAQTADLVLVNGKVVTVDAKESVVEALAVRDGRIVATGTSAAMRKLAASNARTIDLQGRTVIPGLIDSHLHAIRAALSFSTEVNWIGAKSIEEALGRIRKAAQTKPPGSWLIVAEHCSVPPEPPGG